MINNLTDLAEQRCSRCGTVGLHGCTAEPYSTLKVVYPNIEEVHRMYRELIKGPNIKPNIANKYSEHSSEDKFFRLGDDKDV